MATPGLGKLGRWIMVLSTSPFQTKVRLFSEEEGEYIYWIDNCESRSTSRRGKASRPLSGRLLFSIDANQCGHISCSLHVTYPRGKPSWDLSVLWPQVSVICCARCKEFAKETWLRVIQLWKHGLEFRRPKFKSLTCHVLQAWQLGKWSASSCLC